MYFLCSIRILHTSFSIVSRSFSQSTTRLISAAILKKSPVISAGGLGNTVPLETDDTSNAWRVSSRSVVRGFSLTHYRRFFRGLLAAPTIYGIVPTMIDDQDAGRLRRGHWSLSGP